MKDTHTQYFYKQQMFKMWVSVLLSVFALVQSKTINKTIITDNSHWQELANFTVDNSEIDVSKYKSSLTGMKKIIFFKTE